MAQRKNRFKPGDVVCPGITLLAERDFPGDFGIEVRWQPGGDALEVHQGAKDFREFDGFLGKRLETLDPDAIAQPPDSASCNYALSPDRRRVAFRDQDLKLAVLDFSEKERVKRRLTLADVGPIFWSPEGTKLAVSSNTGYFQVYDAERLHVLWTGYGGLPDWSPDGRMIAALSSCNAVAVYEAEEGEILGEYILDKEIYFKNAPDPVWDWGGGKIFALQHAFSVDNGRLTLEYAVRRAYDKRRECVAAGWNRFGRLAVLVFSTRRKNRLLLRSARRPEEHIEIPATDFDNVLWHPDGRTLALVGYQTVRLLDIGDHPEDYPPADPRYADGFASDLA